MKATKIIEIQNHRATPNLVNYDQLCRSFNWHQVKMTNVNNSSYKTLYRLAGIVSLLPLGFNGVDVMLGIGESEGILPRIREADEWFELFGSSRLEGLYMLGISCKTYNK